jgi:hypothetical protein
LRKFRNSTLNEEVPKVYIVEQPGGLVDKALDQKPKHRQFKSIIFIIQKTAANIRRDMRLENRWQQEQDNKLRK